MGIFFDVLEINIVVSVIFLFLFLFSEKLRKRYGAGWMKLVWVLLVLRLVIPYNFSLSSAPIRLLDLPELMQEETGRAESGAVVGTEPVAGNGAAAGIESAPGIEPAAESGAVVNVEPAAVNGQFGGMVEGKGEETSEMGNGEGHNGYPGIVIPEGIGTEKEAGTVGMAGAIGVSSMLFSLWLAGAAICLFYCLIGFLCFWVNYRKNLIPVTDIATKRQVRRLEERLTGKAVIPVYQSRMAKSPMLVGIFSPRLILSVALTGKKEWEEKELELIVAHELCHYIHKDLWLKLLMMFAWCINWFNPFVWMMKKQFFYELELACDEYVLSGCDGKQRETYARMMLSFAGEKGSSCAFSTGFGESKKQMKVRIDHMLDTRRRKKGSAGIVAAGILLAAMGLMISCGYKSNEDTAGEQQDGQGTEHGTQGDLEQGQEEKEAEALQENSVPYDPNHVYNEMIRQYGDELFIARQDGIYRLSRDGKREELLYANPYELRRGMEIDQDGLYFCGSFEAGGQEENSARIYRMNLATYEVEDVLALFSQMYDALYDITVIDGKLYVTSGYVGTKLGFELDEDGRAVKTLDADAEDFLYKEDNDYWELLQKVYNNEVAIGSEEYEELMEKANGMYRGVIDLAASQKMLNENQVVMKYKDELLSSIYLKKPDGNYEFLCDTIAAYPVLVTETGVYYLPDERSSIWYVDYETQTRQKIWEEDGRERKEIQLANYDRDYLYFTSKRYLGRDQEGISVHEVYLMRVPRWGEGKAEKVYRFETDKNMGSLYRKCAVAKGKMFFEDYGTISLDPYANGMGPENSGELSEDGMAMRQIIEAFAEAYFKNDEEALRGYLAEGFEGNPDFYPYPERAEEIEELYLSGVPEGNVPVGVVCYVSYEFSGNMEMDDAYSYLSMEVEKTGQGWKILSYGLEG